MNSWLANFGYDLLGTPFFFPFDTYGLSLFHRRDATAVGSPSDGEGTRRHRQRHANVIKLAHRRWARSKRHGHVPVRDGFEWFEWFDAAPSC